MKRNVFMFLFFAAAGMATAKTVSSEKQIEAAMGVIERVAGKDFASKVEFEIIPCEDGNDVYELEPGGRGLTVRGSDGTALCTGVNYYLKNFCNCSYTWRGVNMNLPTKLPLDFEKIRRVTPHKYRYMFNYCAFGYSMPFWKWEDWEKMIDWMAMNGINMPLALTGQEIIWQRVFEPYGLKPADFDDFFVGPAYNAWGRMGNLEAYAGPLTQQYIEQDRILQHEILERERSLGMTPVLQAFSGHIPKAFIRKNPGLNVQSQSWCDFPEINVLNWEEPLFTEIGQAFIEEMAKEYGTDHYYAIDPFNEMTPERGDSIYLSNMARVIYEGMDKADPEGVWMLMTWPFKNPEWEHDFWHAERTEAFFGGVPADRMIALELHGESEQYTGWFKLDGYFGKQWVWGAIQNFGDKVGMWGGLPQIVDNHRKAVESPEKGRLSGLGICMEGLCYNPVVFELLGDMMWEQKPLDLEQWKWRYVEQRYGKITPEVRKAWEVMFDYFYTRYGIFTGTSILSRPGFTSNRWPARQVAEAAEYMVSAAADFPGSDTFQFDLVNILREVFGDYAAQLLFRVGDAFHRQNIAEYKTLSDGFLDYIDEVDALLGTRQEFLLGKWVNDARDKGASPAESALYEWGAKNIITLWGPKGHPGCGGLQGYAMKEWSGVLSDYCKPLWQMFFDEKLAELEGSMPDAGFAQRIMDTEEAWPSNGANYPSEPQGDPVGTALVMWDKYGGDIMEGTLKAKEVADRPVETTPPGMAVGKPVFATGELNPAQPPENAVDGLTELDKAWWGKPFPQSLTIDLERTETIYGFHVIPYWEGGRYYKYTVETSRDGKKWTEVVDMRSNTEIASPNGHKHIFKVKYPDGIKARYARINVLYNSANEGVHIVEFKIFRGEDIP